MSRTSEPNKHDGTTQPSPAALLVCLATLALACALVAGCNDGSERAGPETPVFPIEVFEGTCRASACEAETNPPVITSVPGQP